MKISLILPFLLVVAYAAAQTPDNRIDSTMRAVMEQEHIPGLAYAVVKDGRVLQKNTLGKASIPFDVPVTDETVFQLASCSKIFTALLLGKLFDSKILAPNTTLKEITDSIPEKWKEITILQLAAHQSGIKIANFSKTTTPKEAFELAKTMPFEFESGEKSEYRSSDYWILLYLIEQATGMKYFQALDKYVLQPLSLNHTFVNNPRTGMMTDLDIIPFQAQEYHWFKKENTLKINQMWFKETDYAAGGIYSSIDDVVKIAQEFDIRKFVSEPTWKLISTPLKLNNGEDGSYGLALIVRNYENHKIIEHSGGPALADFVKSEKEGYTFIVLTNNRGVYPYLAKLLATFYIKDLIRPGPPDGWE